MNTASTSVSLESLPGRRGGPRSGVRLLPLVRWFAVAFALIYGATCLGVYGAQRYLVFDPDRTLRATPADYSFPVRDVSIVVPGKPKRPLHGWWIPATNPPAKPALYLHGNDANVSTSIAHIAPLRQRLSPLFII